VKDRAGTGFYSRQQHEPLLIGVKGKPPSPIYVPPSVIEAPRGRHSEKPDVFRETLEKMYPHWGRKHRVELFARKPLPEWSVSGFEAS
jgi:N6-adenosine-specific RNA methylase IME4